MISTDFFSVQNKGVALKRNCNKRVTPSLQHEESSKQSFIHFYYHWFLHTAITSKYEGLFTSLFKSLYEGDLPTLGKSILDGVLS